MEKIQLLHPRPNPAKRKAWATDPTAITPRNPIVFVKNARKFANPDRLVKGKAGEV